MTRRSTSDYLPGYPATAMGLLTPPILWACYFVLIYSLHGMVCVGELENSLIRAESLPEFLMAVTLLAIALHASIGVWSWRLLGKLNRRVSAEPTELQQRARFLAAAAAANAGLFLVATVWIGLPVLILEPCL
ncbi:hypothetical protein [Marinobacter salicampi]|uniref:hypothetical protein n=1 Tax=Marinobacter salicampi TaxID=435907 RepID=UPI00140DB7E8|nr:hypothetical protein [Marinobacter salicampi]